MTLILNQETLQQETFLTASGRFFEPLGTPPAEEATLAQVEPSITDVLQAQREAALEALTWLGKIQQKRDLASMASSLPQLVAPGTVDDARGYLSDWGTIWRRQTDAIGDIIATQLPEQHLGRLLVAHDDFYTRGRKLYGENNGSISAYYSLLQQSEVNAGIRPASEEQWLDFLGGIILL